MVKTPGNASGINPGEIVRYYNGQKYYLMETERFHHVHVVQSSQRGYSMTVMTHFAWPKKGK